MRGVCHDRRSEDRRHWLRQRYHLNDLADGHYLQILARLTQLTNVAARLGYTVRALTFAALPLLIGKVTVANARFSTDAIDPTRHAENRAMEINGRFVDNTVQQLLLFSIATLALSPALTPSGLRVIPIAVTVFVIARVVFWVGYRVRPIYRAPGMSATGYLNAGLLGYGIWRIIAG